MDYCGPKPLRYAEFLEWDDLSRSAALAWQARENAKCGSCGQVKADWTDAEGRQQHPAPFVVVDHWCPGCEALGQRRIVEGSGEKPPGISHVFAPAPPPAVPVDGA